MRICYSRVNQVSFTTKENQTPFGLYRNPTIFLFTNPCTTAPVSPAKPSALQVIPPTRHTTSSICYHQGGDCGVSKPGPTDWKTASSTRLSGSWTPSRPCPPSPLLPHAPLNSEPPPEPFFLHVLICIFVIVAFLCTYMYIYLICTYLYFYVLLLVFSVICMHQGVRE